jgi:DNA polymerase
MFDGNFMNNELRHQYLQAMGIQQWVMRNSEAAAEEAKSPHATLSAEPLSEWQTLERQVSGCTRCTLHETRTQTVFGTGNRDADWMIIGEAPGADEDRQGEPFVGRAGRLLNEIIFAAGYQRADVFITNMLKCRPPANRNPSMDEIECCQPYLEQQIELVRPKLLLALGRIAAHGLLQTTAPLGSLRGTVHHYGGKAIPLIVTYHPAYLLRSPLEKRKVWQDLQLAQTVYRQQLAG